MQSAAGLYLIKCTRFLMLDILFYTRNGLVAFYGDLEVFWKVGRR
jgi:hypothetical protein